MTAFKREARWRQHRWALDELGVTKFGTHTKGSTHPDLPPIEIDNGTKLLSEDARSGNNFLTPRIHQVAKDRIAHRQESETLDAKRLERDFLSSMPMAFNLFGEASFPENEVSRQRLAETLGVLQSTPSEIAFEWSPARRSDKYTRDKTAFDIALFLGAPTSARTVVGIETKYHEHPTKEQRPGATKPDQSLRYAEQTDFLIALAESSMVLRPGWQDKVLNTPLRQIWRDHLLALSMRRHPEEWTAQTKYVLLYPNRNVSFRDAAQEYSALLSESNSSFLALTIEALVEAAFAHGGDTEGAFRRRYLW